MNKMLPGTAPDDAQEAGFSVTPRRRIPLGVVRATMLVLDMVGAILLSALIFRAYGDVRDYPVEQVYFGLSIYMVAWLLAAQATSLYGEAATVDARLGLGAALRTWLLAFGLLLLVAFGLSVIAGFSRVWLFAWALSVALWVGVVRLVWDEVMQRMLAATYCLERVLVIGRDRVEAQRLARQIEHGSKGQIRIVGLQILADADAAAIEAMVREGSLEHVIIAEDPAQVPAIQAMLGRLRRIVVRASVVRPQEWLVSASIRFEKVGGVPALVVSDQPLRGFDVLVKRTEDLVLAGCVLLALSPLLLLVALAIRLDSAGPILFRQRRAGFGGQVFEIWKFRSMHHVMCDEGARRQTSRRDPRVTRVGRFLRRTSIDELPQLLNVIMGQMSLVGPRPHALGMRTLGLELDQIVEDYAARHRIKPGMTGWAQVNGLRGEVASIEHLRQRVEYDLAYIENWSLAFDLWILLRTIRIVLYDDKAY